MEKTDQPLKIFVVEDNEWFNKLIVHNLSLKENCALSSYHSAKEVLADLNQNPDIITIDYRLPDMTGHELLKRIKAFNPAIEVIVISEQDEIEVAVELLQDGAADYIVKSKTIKERLFHAISRIEGTLQLKSQIKSLKSEVKTKYSFDNSLIGQSPPMQKVFALMEKSLDNKITVSITGETGTGKEVAAKAIHYNSTFSDKPFVAINMAAIPDDLIESELFGHKKGAFTGAISDRKGKFLEAHGGTLFLDEIGEMNIHLQAKLLRALQEKEITPVGSNTSTKIDCRIIVATNRDLKEEVKKGNFREDLYYRFLGLPIHLPPLSERGKDILILSKHFIQLFAKENGVEPKHLDESATSKLMSYSWPGNIRELKSVIDLAMVLSNDEFIKADDISLNSEDLVAQVISEELSMREYEVKIVQHFMEKYDGNTKKVADRLQIGQTTVYRLLKEATS